MVVDGDEFYSARSITFFSLKRWKGGGKVVESWWKGGGKVVERWWKGGGKVVERWWKGGGKVVQEFATHSPFVSQFNLFGEQDIRGSKRCERVGLQDVNWRMCPPPFPGFQLVYL